MKLVLRTRDAYFWATQGGAELDLLTLIKGKRYGFEFKYADAPGRTRSMQAAIEDLGLEYLWVIYPGQQEYVLDARISVIPLDRILNRIPQQAKSSALQRTRRVDRDSSLSGRRARIQASDEERDGFHNL